MKATTIVMMVASIIPLILGVFLLFSTVNINIQNSDKFTKKSVRINAIFNVIMGFIGLILTLLHHLLTDNDIIVIIFIVIMLIASIIQKFINKKIAKK